MRPVLLLSVLCVSTPAFAQSQWSEPVTVAESLAPYGSGPELVPLAGDTLWVLWMALGAPARLMACRYASGNWGRPESVTVSSHGLYWPSGVVDDSGRMLVACYEGSYPTARDGQDSWGIYTMTRTETGWSRPALAQPTMAEAFPTSVRLGKARDGSVGMIWDESSGGMTSIDSVMFSRRTQSGWTPRRCLAAGQYPDIEYRCGSLIPGDSADFTIAFQRTAHPETGQTQVWDLNDSLTGTEWQFSGVGPVLTRGPTGMSIVFLRGDSLLGSLNHGSGWAPERLVATDIGVGRPGLCADAIGWAWACWPDHGHQTILASYNPGIDWSPPETVATFSSLGNPGIASDDSGVLHCVWFDHAQGTQGRLRHARRYSRPGVEEALNSKVRATRPLPTVVRNTLFLPASSFRLHPSFLIDVSGRAVLSLHAGRNDLSRLAPGVYFVRAAQTRAIQKVVVTR